MATQKRNNRSAASSARKKTSPAQKNNQKVSAAQKKRAAEQESIRREGTAIGLLLLAIFSLLGWFQNAMVLDALCNLEKGLVGTGFYILPVLFVWAAYILWRGGKRMVWMRAWMSLALSAIVGAFGQVLRVSSTVWKFSIIRDFYQDGVAGRGGGILSGLLGEILKTSFSTFGAVFLLLLLLGCCLMIPLRMTPKSLILAIRNLRLAEEDDELDDDISEVVVNRIAERQNAKAQRRLAREEGFDFDLPIDDVPTKQKVEPVAEKTVSPGQYLVDRKREETVKQEAELPRHPKDTMPLPLLTDLFDAQRPITPRTADPAPERRIVPEPLQEQVPVVISEPVPTPTPDPVSEAIHESTIEPVAPVEEEPNWTDEAPLDEMPRPLHEPENPSPIEKIELEPEPESLEEEPEDPPETMEAEATYTTPSVEATSAASTEAPVYRYPPLDLLNPASGGMVDATEEMRLNAERLSDTLRSFGVQPNLVNVTRGPTVTRFELQLNRGVKLSKITGLSEDIALALGATGVRISAIPEKISVVGIEVPNRTVSMVCAREVIDSKEFATHKSDLAFAVGKDIGGKGVVGNIAKLPHLLIAGTTGSGKSVCMNSLIISLLYKSSPEDVRLIMIDPKMVELGIYNGIPHLLIPVVTDPKKASGSLQWAVSEMMRRYSIMSESGTRDIASYNKAIEGNPERKKLPKIVVVIDELADLMMVAAKEVEESICRVAQMGRAAGVHLVIATQRPSANVITGLMKANIPSRIAFAVASSMESRIILDTGGAEKLIGRGDMLYCPLGEGKAKRIQGCFITDEEVQRVTEFVKQSGKAEYSQEIMDHINKEAEKTGKSTVSVEQDPEDDRDELLYDAIDVILDLGQASVSVLQRKLKLGYSRASRIVDQMEEMGVVGPHKGSKPRDILISKEKWELIKNGEQMLNEPVPDELD